MSEFLEISFITTEDEDKSTQNTYLGVPKKQKILDDWITPYEYSRLVGCRAKQLSCGYPPKVEWVGVHNPILIAKKEIEQRVIPLILLRKIQDSEAIDGSGYITEAWDVREMNIRDC